MQEWQRQAEKYCSKKSSNDRSCSAASQLPLKPLIVIDVGHGYMKDMPFGYDGGGRVADPWAKKGSGVEVHEYTINLAIAKKLEKAFKAEGFEVQLTQNGDQRPLPTRFQSRIDTGRDRPNKELHISIHADKEPTGTRTGAQVFYHRDTPKGSLSIEWANRLRDALQAGRQEHPWHNTSVIQYGTYISQNRDSWSVKNGLGDMPAVLVETGFLSNGKDLARLRSDDGQQWIADRIVKATVEQYERMVSRGQTAFLRMKPLEYMCVSDNDDWLDAFRPLPVTVAKQTVPHSAAK